MYLSISYLRSGGQELVSLPPRVCLGLHMPGLAHPAGWCVFTNDRQNPNNMAMCLWWMTRQNQMHINLECYNKSMWWVARSTMRQSKCKQAWSMCQFRFHNTPSVCQETELLERVAKCWTYPRCGSHHDTPNQTVLSLTEHGDTHLKLRAMLCSNRINLSPLPKVSVQNDANIRVAARHMFRVSHKVMRRWNADHGYEEICYEWCSGSNVVGQIFIREFEDMSTWTHEYSQIFLYNMSPNLQVDDSGTTDVGVMPCISSRSACNGQKKTHGWEFQGELRFRRKQLDTVKYVSDALTVKGGFKYAGHRTHYCSDLDAT